jgi:hypothetical protein
MSWLCLQRSGCLQSPLAIEPDSFVLASMIGDIHETPTWVVSWTTIPRTLSKLPAAGLLAVTTALQHCAVPVEQDCAATKSGKKKREEICVFILMVVYKEARMKIGRGRAPLCSNSRRRVLSVKLVLIYHKGVIQANVLPFIDK